MVAAYEKSRFFVFKGNQPRIEVISIERETEETINQRLRTYFQSTGSIVPKYLLEERDVNLEKKDLPAGGDSQETVSKEKPEPQRP